MKAILLFLALSTHALMAENFVTKSFWPKDKLNIYEYKNIIIYYYLTSLECNAYITTGTGRLSLENCHDYQVKLEQLYEFQRPLREKEKRKSHPELLKIRKAIDFLKDCQKPAEVSQELVEYIRGIHDSYKYKNISVELTHGSITCVASRRGTEHYLDFCDEYLESLKKLYELQKPLREKKEKKKEKKRKRKDPPELIGIEEAIHALINNENPWPIVHEVRAHISSRGAYTYYYKHISVTKLNFSYEYYSGKYAHCGYDFNFVPEKISGLYAQKYFEKLATLYNLQKSLREKKEREDKDAPNIELGKIQITINFYKTGTKDNAVDLETVRYSSKNRCTYFYKDICAYRVTNSYFAFKASKKLKFPDEFFRKLTELYELQNQQKAREELISIDDQINNHKTSESVTDRQQSPKIFRKNTCVTM
jgi:hypothetical protein